MGDWRSGLGGPLIAGTTQTCSSQKQSKEGLRVFSSLAIEQSGETHMKIQEALGCFWTMGQTCEEEEGKRVQTEVRTHTSSS